MCSVDYSIAIVAHNRPNLAARTVKSICEYLEPNNSVFWYIGEDSGNKEVISAVLDCLAVYGFDHFSYHCEDMSPNNYHCGNSWNLALKMAHQKSDVVLWMEDDWELRHSLDISAYLSLLRENNNVGIVRLGHMPVGSALFSVGYKGIHYLRFEKTTQYAYSGNPHLRHKRFVDSYGYFSEKLNPGNIEVELDGRVRGKSGPEIWWPIDLGGWGVFGHIGKEKSYE